MANAIAQSKGVPGLRLLEMDHPLGGLTETELAPRFEQVIDQVFTHLENRNQ